MLVSRLSNFIIFLSQHKPERAKTVNEILIIGTTPVALETLKVLRHLDPNTIRSIDVVDTEKIQIDVKELNPKANLIDVESALNKSYSLVIEMVGASRAKELVPKFLERGNVVVLLAASLLANEEYLARISEIAKKSGGRVIVPFGAVAGLDVVNALSPLSDLEIEIEIRRPPQVLARVLREAGFELDAAEVPLVLYEGSALEELKKVKDGINTIMAAILAASRDVKLRIVADNQVEGSKYKIKVNSSIANVKIESSYKTLEEDPTVSEIIVYSVIRVIKTLLEDSPVKVI